MSARPSNVLLLAGTTEASQLAALLAERSDVAPTASLAGHTREPAAFPCTVRRGGFGGVDGLARELRSHPYDLLVDATHPFSRVMPEHAAEAAIHTGTSRLRLLRPGWTAGHGDRWHRVPDLDAAAAMVTELGLTRPFLAVGRLELAAFAQVSEASFLVRSIEAPDPLPLADARVVLDRGPFDVDAEIDLFAREGVDGLVAKDSGGSAAAPKLAAARALGLPVVLVDRPPAPAGGTVVATVTDALAWVTQQVTAQERGATIR